MVLFTLYFNKIFFDVFLYYFEFQLLVLENGMYGRRIAELSKSSGINVKVIPVNLKTLQETLQASSNEIGGVIVVHCETSSGKINPVNDIGDIVKQCIPGKLRMFRIVFYCL